MLSEGHQGWRPSRRTRNGAILREQTTVAFQQRNRIHTTQLFRLKVKYIGKIAGIIPGGIGCIR